MSRTVLNLAGHELIGLPVQVVSSSDPARKGVKGVVVDETEGLLVIGTGKKEIRIPKKGSTFRFSLEKTKVDVQGWTITAKPEERTKRLIRLAGTWRAR